MTEAQWNTLTEAQWSAMTENTGTIGQQLSARTEGIRSLVQAGKVDRSLFDEKDLAEISAEELFPGERLVACRNPILADERARKRDELLTATEKDLNVIVRATQRAKNALSGKEKIGLRVGRVIGRHKMEKHFVRTITETSFTYARREENIKAEAALDGLYVIRSSVPKVTLTAEKLVSLCNAASSNSSPNRRSLCVARLLHLRLQSPAAETPQNTL